MRDADVRRALHTLLRTEHAHEWANTQIFNELSLCGEVRVDVAVLNGHLAGYELKSERDTLERLPVQVGVYSRVLDQATLVVAERHLVAAGALLPPWWGIVVARGDGEQVLLERARPPQWNDAVDSQSLVRLLWRDEVLDELTRRGLADGVRSKTRSMLSAVLTDRLANDELRHVVRERLKQRARWRVVRPRRQDGAAFRAVARPWDFLHSPLR